MAAVMVTSRESELDRQLEDLIGKMVDGTATPADREQFIALSKRRSHMMYPKKLDRIPLMHRTRKLKPVNV